MATMVLGWRELLHSLARPLQVFSNAMTTSRFSSFCNEFVLISFFLLVGPDLVSEEEGEERRRGGGGEGRKTALIIGIAKI